LPCIWRRQAKSIKESETIEIEKRSANVYEDLGLPDAAEMQVKATLAAKIGEIIVSVRATHLDEPADCLSAKHIKAIVSYLINDRAHIYAWCIRVH